MGIKVQVLLALNYLGLRLRRLVFPPVGASAHRKKGYHSSWRHSSSDQHSLNCSKGKKNIVNPRICKKKQQAAQCLFYQKLVQRNRGHLPPNCTTGECTFNILYIFYGHPPVYNGIGRGALANPLPKSPRGSQGSSRRIEVCVLY
jgi:hypothetical protein